MELGNKLDAELPAPGNESAHIQDFAHVGGDRLVVGDELFRAVERFAGQTWNLRTLEVIRIFHGDIRTKVTDDFVPPFVVEMVGVFQELMSVDSELLPI